LPVRRRLAFLWQGYAAPDLRARAKKNLKLEDVPRARGCVLSQFEKV
jgi:hypothetical protein